MGAGATVAQTITGSDKVDVLVGSTKADTINGGAGADTISGGKGADTIDGGAGNDTFTTAGMVAADIEGTGTGTSTGVVVNLSDAAVSNVTVTNNGGQNISGAVTSVAAGTAAYVYGTVSPNHSSVVDTLTSIENVTLSGNGTNYVVGSAGANVITGGTGRDFIDGGAGNDTINGGAGADVLTGGTGTDTFVFAAGASGTPSDTNFDEIIGFASATDVIDYSAAITIQAGGATTTAGTAAISANGIATFNAADDTLAERITATQAAIVLGGNTAGETAAFMSGADAYVFISDGVDGVGADDVLIKLTGVDLTTTSFDLLTISAGNLTIA
jgi:Ca2+-binding RTX toxin-like protein